MKKKKRRKYKIKGNRKYWGFSRRLKTLLVQIKDRELRDKIYNTFRNFEYKLNE